MRNPADGPARVPEAVDLANRLSEAEGKLRALEESLSTLFHRVNVNRPGEPSVVLDRILLTLAELLAALERVNRYPPKRIARPVAPFEVGVSILDVRERPGGEARHPRIRRGERSEGREGVRSRVRGAVSR